MAKCSKDVGSRKNRNNKVVVGKNGSVAVFVSTRYCNTGGGRTKKFIQQCMRPPY